MILIGEGTVFTRDPANPMILNGGVAIKGDTIAAVGDFITMKAIYPDAEIVDAGDGLIMPGFINTHHHIYSALARGLSLKGYDPHGFLDILEGLWWRLDKGLNLDDTRASAVATYISCIENGVTTVFDHHASYGETTGSLKVIAEEAVRFGVRSCLCYETSDRNGRAEMEKAVAENIDFADFAARDPDRLAGMIGLHASFTLSDESMRYILDSNKAGTGYHVHVAEGTDDVDISREKFGARPAERLYNLGILGKKTIAAHCIHINENEIRLLKETGTIVVHNPESNMGNAVGAPEVLTMSHEGILTGLGTDGYTSDMLESYKAANCLVKHASRNPAVGWTEIPALLFENNRKIAERFFPKPCGILKTGAYGDVIVLDYDPITPLDAGNLNGHMLFGMNGRDVVTTVSGGVVRMKDRRLQGIDKGEVLSEVGKQARSLWSRLNA